MSTELWLDWPAKPSKAHFSMIKVEVSGKLQNNTKKNEVNNMMKILKSLVVCTITIGSSAWASHVEECKVGVEVTEVMNAPTLGAAVAQRTPLLKLKVTNAVRLEGSYVDCQDLVGLEIVFVDEQSSPYPLSQVGDQGVFRYSYSDSLGPDGVESSEAWFQIFR